MVLASSPGAATVELLVRGGTRFSDAVRTLADGATLELGPPSGKGFPLAEADGKELWLVAVGSGIAALRPVLQSVVDGVARFAEVNLLFGVRDAGAIPLADEIEAWRKGGCHVTIAVSGEVGSWSGARGYVQDVLPTLTSDLSGSVVFACGMAEMVRELRATVTQLGLDPGRVFTNY